MIKVSDSISGLAIASLGLYVLVKSQSFPKVGVSALSPAFYPGLIGALVMLCGATIAIISLMKGKPRFTAELPIWLVRPGTIIAVLAIPAAILLYGLLSTRIGFLATCGIVTLMLLSCFRVSPLKSIFVTVVLSVSLHVVFAMMMRVPLPSGFLEDLLR